MADCLTLMLAIGLSCMCSSVRVTTASTRFHMNAEVWFKPQAPVSCFQLHRHLNASILHQPDKMSQTE